MRKCYVCKKRITYDSRGSRCLECDRMYQRKRRQEKPRECARCKKMKPTAQFYQKKSGHYESYCRQCKNEMKRENYHRKRASAELLTVHVVGCEHCMFQDDCNYLVWERHEDPYCFVSNPYHGLFVQYAETRRQHEQT